MLVLYLFLILFFSVTPLSAAMPFRILTDHFCGLLWSAMLPCWLWNVRFHGGKLGPLGMVWVDTSWLDVFLSPIEDLSLVASGTRRINVCSARSWLWAGEGEIAQAFILLHRTIMVLITITADICVGPQEVWTGAYTARVLQSSSHKGELRELEFPRGPYSHDAGAVRSRNGAIADPLLRLPHSRVTCTVHPISRQYPFWIMS